MDENRPIRAFRFGIQELGIAVSLIAVALSCWKCIVWLDHAPLDLRGALAIFVVTSALMVGCTFAAVGVLFRCGLKAGILGAVLGAVVSALIIGYFIANFPSHLG